MILYMFQQAIKYALHHPWQFRVFVLIISIFKRYARVLVVHYVVGTLQTVIYYYPSNFPNAFFLPLLYTTCACLTIISLLQIMPLDLFTSKWATISWQYTFPLFLTFKGKHYRVFGISIFALFVAILDSYSSKSYNTSKDLEPSMDISGALKAFIQENTYMSHYLATQEINLHHLVETYDNIIRTRANDIGKLDAFLIAMFNDIPLQDQEQLKWCIFHIYTCISCIYKVTQLLFALAICTIHGLMLLYREPLHGGDDLRHATLNNNLTRAKTLLSRGIQVDSRGSVDGSTCLHICAQQATVAVARVFLEEYGANPNIRDHLGFTPLHWAVQMRKEENCTSRRLNMIKILLDFGGDPRVQNYKGITPISIARRKPNRAAFNVLMESITLTTDEVGDYT